MIEFSKEQCGTTWVSVDTEEELDSFKSEYSKYADGSFIADNLQGAPLSIELRISPVHFEHSAIARMESSLS